MTKRQYRGSQNRIVRVNIEAIHSVIDNVAQVYNVPYQLVFSSYLRWIETQLEADNIEVFDEWFVDEYTSRDDEIPF